LRAIQGRNCLANHPSKRLVARCVSLSTGLPEDGIAALDERYETWVLAREALGGGAEKGEARDEFEGVGAATHHLFERDAAGELVAGGAGDFFVAGADPPSLKLRRGGGRSACRAVALAKAGGTAEAGELREDVPDPVAGFASPVNLLERGVVAGGGASLDCVEAD